MDRIRHVKTYIGWEFRMEPSEIAARLRRTLKDCGLSQAALEQYGLPYRTVQNYVSKNQVPGGEALTKIRDATGVNIDWLLTGEGEQFEDRSKMEPRKLELSDIQELMTRFTDFADYFTMKLPAMESAPLKGVDSLDNAMQRAVIEALKSDSSLPGPAYVRARDEAFPNLAEFDVAKRPIGEVVYILRQLDKAFGSIDSSV
jgi:transcriptional regulator with XRE-family HTH domain